MGTIRKGARGDKGNGKIYSFSFIASFASFAFIASSYGQPYYAAKKGLSCAACHVSPAGGGVRKPRQSNPVFINDSINLGADLRNYFSKTEKRKNSTFSTSRSALYVLAQPVKEISLVLANDQGTQSELYALLQHPDYPIYAKTGRFYVPYGLQQADSDNSSYVKISPFAPAIGFSLFPSQSDTGLEIGFNPKDKYFLNLALTNGAANGGADNSEAKAVTGRWGFVTNFLGLGGSLYNNKTSDLSTGQKERRYSAFGWLKAGPFILLGEQGWGENTANVTEKKTNLQATYAELDFDLLPNLLVLKGKLDRLDPNTDIQKDELTRYTLATEWYALKFMSLETQYRIFDETPQKTNNQGLVLTHLWF